MKMPDILGREFYQRHGELLCWSYNFLTGEELLPEHSERKIEELYIAPFVLVSHGTQADPIFNFGNQAALDLFEFSWEEFTRLPSRKSAEPLAREERQRLLQEVTQKGYIADYSGIRVSATGNRFSIKNAVVWNIVDSDGTHHGQAAMFSEWSPVE